MVCSWFRIAPLSLCLFTLHFHSLSALSLFGSTHECGGFPFNISIQRPSSPEFRLRTPDLIRKSGYHVETHRVVSQDGYILTLFRIPHGKNRAKSKRKARPVVLIQHGVICSSSDWLMNSEHNSLPYILANSCYDVWLDNARGSSYSNRHVSFTIANPAYWEFSWHEMGVFDLPAIIDYILASTNEPSLYHIGHSIGSTSFLVAMSSWPEYNAKIRSSYALAPVAYLDHMTCPVSLLRPLICPAAELLWHLLPRTGTKAWTLNGPLGPKVCTGSPVARVGCSALFYGVTGFDPCPVNKTEQMLAILGHTPDVTSSRTILHYVQLKMAKLFCAYDFGTKGNEARYGGSTPPNYNLSKITAKVAVFWGQMDFVSVPKDVARLVRQLPNVIANHRVKSDGWSHLDFTYGSSVKSLVYDHLLRLMAVHS